MPTVLKTADGSTHVVSNSIDEIDDQIRKATGFILVLDDNANRTLRINPSHIVSYANQIEVHREPVNDIKRLQVTHALPRD